MEILEDDFDDEILVEDEEDDDIDVIKLDKVMEEKINQDVQEFEKCINSLYPTIDIGSEIDDLNNDQVKTINMKKVSEKIGSVDLIKNPTKSNIYSFYSFKGGVYKTSLLIQCAIDLTTIYKKKVLIIDLDPQCNSTIYLMNRKNEQDFLKINKYKVADVVDINLDSAINHYLENIVFKPLKIMRDWDIVTILRNVYFKETTKEIPNISLNGTNNIKDVLNYIWHVNLNKFDECIDETKKEEYLENLFLISGSIEIDQLTEKMTKDGKFLHTTRRTLLKLAEMVDYIFIDLNPGLSKLNKLMMICSDKIIVPIGNDPFSMASIINLPSILFQCYNEFYVEIDNIKNEFKKYFNNTKYDFIVNINYKRTTSKISENMIEKIKNYLNLRVNEYDKIVNNKGGKTKDESRIKEIKTKWTKIENKKWLDFIKNKENDGLIEKINKECLKYKIDESLINNHESIESIGFTHMMFVMERLIKILKRIRGFCFTENFNIIARIPNYNQQITVMHRFGLTFVESLKHSQLLHVNPATSKGMVSKQLNNVLKILCPEIIKEIEINYENGNKNKNKKRKTK